MELCTNKEICGSCSWSNISYKEQLELKIKNINTLYKCDQIIPSPKKSHYRNKMDFVINYQGLMGLRQKGKWWKVIDNHTCFLADKKIENIFHTTRNFLQKATLSFYDRKSHEGLLRYMVIRSTKTGQTMLNIVTSLNHNNENILEKLHQLSQLLKDTSVVWSINHTQSDTSLGNEIIYISGKEYITEEVNGFKYKIRPNSFFQTNSYAAEILQKEVMKLINCKVETTLDMYSGSGFFTLPFAKKSKKVIGIDSNPQNICDANDNKLLNKIDNIEFIEINAEETDIKKYKPQVVILDPPRSGLHKKVISSVLKGKPQYIIYVSCKYDNFYKEYEELKKDYVIEKALAIDLFPHTPHVEVIHKLTRLT